MQNKEKPKIPEMKDEELIRLVRGAGMDVRTADYVSELISRYTRVILLKANAAGKRGKFRSADTDDLVSEGFLGLMSAVKAYNEERGSFAALVGTCIDNRIKTALLGMKKMPEQADGFDLSSLTDKSPGMDERLIEKEAETELSVHLRKLLSPREYSVLKLYLNDYNYRQISEKLEISLKSTDNALARAKTKIRDTYGPEK